MEKKEGGIEKCASPANSLSRPYSLGSISFRR